MNIFIPPPELQISFAEALERIRREFLQEALGEALETCDISVIDAELQMYAPKNDIAAIARQGLRGELIFITPTLVERAPKLLGYYRLLLGHSQKSFYCKETGLAAFKILEERNLLPPAAGKRLTDLCLEMNKCASLLINGIGVKRISRSLLDDLTLLTLGPQLRGGANVQKGTDAIEKVFNVIKEIVKGYAEKIEKKRIVLTNASGRSVYIEFASDPDIIIREKMGVRFRNIIAIEVKGGQDFSNIHNRVGEAEKSHQKAKETGYVECWTIINVENIDYTMAKKESPSTNEFYKISQITAGTGDEYEDFRQRIASLTGIPLL